MKNKVSCIVIYLMNYRVYKYIVDTTSYSTKVINTWKKHCKKC